MNYLVAKTKGRNSAYYNILSKDEPFYTIPNLDHTHYYQDDYKLEEEQWFIVEDFSNQPYFLDFLNNQFDNTAYSPLPRDSYPKLSFLIGIQNNDIYTFQRIVNSFVLQKKLVSFKLNEAPELLDNKYTIVLNLEPDAIYDKQNDKLYFKNLSSITSIFSGIDSLYREATNEETNNFLELQILKVNQNFHSDNVKTANRRRIKAAMEKYDSFNEEQKADLPNYLKNYCGDNIYDEETGKFVIDNEEQLTKVLNGINQRFYTTEIDGEKRLANSVTPI